MFNKKKCASCKYSAVMAGSKKGSKNFTSKATLSCDYALRTGTTCVKRDGEDLRGSNPNRCKLYELDERHQ